MSIKSKILKYRLLFYIKLGFIITLISISLIFIFLIYPPREPVFATEDFTFNWILIGILSCFILILASYAAALTVAQYKDYVIKKSIIAGRNYQLSFEDIFENESRKSIIQKILLEPGIHNNELLRQCNLQKGQLQWHLYVLLKYGIIKKEKFGQYVSFFPVISNKEVNKMPLKLIIKSKTSMKILDLIEKNPGINSSLIARWLNMRRNSVKYHVDKLAKLDLIILEKHNREIKLYVNQKADYE